MRTFLHKLMVDITRHPREIVITPARSSSIVVNLFRTYEYWFGRRTGIRFEGSSWLENGVEYHKFGTWEHLLVYGEHLVRNFFKLPEWGFKVVRVPALALTNGLTMPPPFRFAIALDNVQENKLSTLSCVVSGSNGFMFACGGYSSNSSAIIAAFNSVAMTSSATQIWIGSSNPINGIYLAGPSTGTHNLVITNGNGQCSIATTYSGCAQVTPDNYAKAASSNTITVTVNTATANCWMHMITIAANNIPTAGTNATARSLNSGGDGENSSFDSNGNIATGSFSMTATGYGPGQSTGGVAYKFAQVAGLTINSGFFFAAGAM